jgi:hypothetical protein
MRSALHQRQQELQQLLHLREQQQQHQQRPEQPTSYQVQLQAYLDAQQQQQQPGHQYVDVNADHHQQIDYDQQLHDQQQPDQQHSKHWSSRSLGLDSSSPAKHAAAASAVGGSKVLHQAEQFLHWSPQQQQQEEEQDVPYRLSIPDSCEGDAELSWAAAALDAVAANAAAADNTASAAFTAPAAEDLDSVAEEFAALLEAGGPQQQQQHRRKQWEGVRQGGVPAVWLGQQQQQQRLQQQEDDPELEAWGSRVDLGRPDSSSNDGSGRHQQQQLQRPPQTADDSSSPKVRDLHLAIEAVVNETVAAFRQYWLMRRAFAAWTARCVARRKQRQAANTAAAASFAAARQQRLLSHCWSGWSAAVVVGSSARSAATQLLERVLQRQVLRDWRLVALSDRAQKQEVLRAWGSQVQEQQVRWPAGDPSMHDAAGSEAQQCVHPATLHHGILLCYYVAALLITYAAANSTTHSELTAYLGCLLNSDVLYVILCCAVRDPPPQQANRLQLEIASLHWYQQTLHRAWRAWVVAWCKAASARVLAAQISTKRKAEVFAALADNAAHRCHKRAAVLRADTFRRARLLLLCVRWWRGWAQYSRVLQCAGAAVQDSARARVLQEVLAAWQGHVRYRCVFGCGSYVTNQRV